MSEGILDVAFISLFTTVPFTFGFGFFSLFYKQLWPVAAFFAALVFIAIAIIFAEAVYEDSGEDVTDAILPGIPFFLGLGGFIYFCLKKRLIALMTVVFAIFSVSALFWLFLFAIGSVAV